MLNSNGERSTDHILVRENEGCCQSKTKCESTHMENVIADQAIPLGIPMVLEQACADNQENKDNEPSGRTVEDSPVSIDAAANFVQVGQTDTMEGDHHDIDKPGGVDVGDKAWVVSAAAVLKANGKGMEWEEILDKWVKLQRCWDGIEVCQS